VSRSRKHDARPRNPWLPGLGLALLCGGVSWLALERASDLRQRTDRAADRLEVLAREIAATYDGEAYRRLLEPDASGETASLPWTSVDASERRRELRAAGSELGLDGPARLIRLDDEARERVRNAPGRAHAGVMELLTTLEGEGSWRAAADYRPGMDQALFDGRASSITEDVSAHLVEVRAYAPVHDLFGGVVGVVEVRRSMERQLLSALFLHGVGIAAAVTLAVVVLVSLLRGPAQRRKELMRRLAAKRAARPDTILEIARDLEERRVQLGHAELGVSRAYLEAVFGRLEHGLKRLDLRLRKHLADGLPDHVGPEPARVFAILAELLENAVRHSHRGGTITVRIALDAEGRSLVFEVADEGEGIAWEQQLLVRESIAAAEPGSCIRGGLSEASAILAAMNGSISFESQPAGGTRAWFTLPIERHRLRALRPSA
jgi:signal transduction histidine kinase